LTKEDFYENTNEEPKISPWKTFLMRALIVVFILCIILVVGIFSLKKYLFPASSPMSYDSIANINPFNIFKGPFPADKKELYILVLGLDQNWTEKNIMHTKGARSDTIMVAHLNREKKTVGLLSIPRDTRVPIPGHYEFKINEACSIGGPELAVKTVEELLKIKIDYYIVVKTNALPELIDTIGGVEVYVDKDMDYDDNWGHLHIHLKEGWQIIDGDRSVQFSRFRKDEEGDLARIRRQQQVLCAIKDKVSRTKSLVELQKIVEKVSKNIQTDLSTGQIFDLITTYRHMDMGGVKMGTIPTYGEDIDGVSFQIIDETQLADYINKYLLDIEPVFNVEICYDEKDKSASARLQEELSKLGYKVTEVKNETDLNYKTTQIITRSDKIDKNNLSGIIKLLGNPDIGNGEPADGSSADIIIMLGRDYGQTL